MSSGDLNYRAPHTAEGDFVRADSVFRRWIRRDGSTPFTPDPGRYHLYVSLACPWAHRTIIMRILTGLTEVVSLSVVDPVRDEQGWAFRDVPGAGADPINGFAYLSEAYRATDPTYDGNVTVPVLWDTHLGQIVSNESSEIIRMLNAEFADYAGDSPDYYPPPLRERIDEINARIYSTVNNGVYRCGFARSQGAYDRAFDALFATLDWCEEHLGSHRYLVGNVITEADWRLFTTLVRFDAVYVGHFKTNRNRIVDMPHLWDYARELYQWPGIAQTVDWDHIKRHYYMTHPRLNPSRIVPKGPNIDWSVPHTRGA